MTAAPCVFRSLIDRPVLGAVGGELTFAFCFAASPQACATCAQSARAGVATHSKTAHVIDAGLMAMDLIICCLPQRFGHLRQVISRVLLVRDLGGLDTRSKLQRQPGREF